MRLNGWVRLGIVASVLWAVGAGMYVRSADVERAVERASFIRRVCTETNAKNRADTGGREVGQNDCGKMFKDILRANMIGSWGNVAIVARAPIPIAWLFVYLAVLIWRWVAKGFKRDPQ